MNAWRSRKGKLAIQITSELGINHNGIYETLLDLTDMALSARADFVKIQLRTPELCVPKDQWDLPKVCPWDGEIRTYLEYRKGMEFTDNKLAAFDSYVRASWVEKRWSASVWDIPSLDRLLDYDVPWIKIPSAKLTDLDLIRESQKTGLPLMISTGMSTSAEVMATLESIHDYYPLTVLHCNGSYPAKDSEANLKTIATLKRIVGHRPNTNVGFSNHHASPLIPIGAMWLGAEVIEAHITLDRTMQGSDHAASLEEKGLRFLIRERNRIQKAMGDGLITLYDSERPARKKLRGN